MTHPVRHVHASGAGESDPAIDVSAYAVVHLATQDLFTPLIEPQLVDHMEQQACLPGAGRPERVVVGFLEPMRLAFTQRARDRLRRVSMRAPHVQTLLLPYTSRLSLNRNGRWLGRRIRRAVGDLPVLFHCRGERSVEWAAAFSQVLPRSAIIADIRGAWPEEFLFHRGYDGPAGADAESVRGYDQQVAQLRSVLTRADWALTVSRPLLEWLEGLGAPADRLSRVPCCTVTTRFDEAIRERVRAELGVGGKLVFAYVGTLTRYQHFSDGIVPFFRYALANRAAHLLCITNDPDSARAQLAAGGVAEADHTVLSLPQEDVAGYLCAADAGLLIRAPSRMNSFSQPTKMAEYLASGVPVIASYGTGDVPAILERAGAGWGIDWFNLDPSERVRDVGRICNELLSCSAELRTKALALCEREFLWSSYVGTVRTAYTEALRRSGRRGAREIAPS